MTDAKRLAKTMQTYGVTSQQLYMACVLLAEVGLESALEYLRRAHPTPEMPEWEQQGELKQAAMVI